MSAATTEETPLLRAEDGAATPASTATYQGVDDGFGNGQPTDEEQAAEGPLKPQVSIITIVSSFLCYHGQAPARSGHVSANNIGR